jgi:TIR domain
MAAPEEHRMRAIFISYRRDDAEGQAGRLFDDLTRTFGTEAVFMDVAAIEPGRDFRLAIDQQVASCGVLLAIIGKSWITAKDESGARRLDNVMDFVRLETASALKRDIPVVPVLVQGATMPRGNDLPGDLKELAYRNAVELTHARWDSDVELLIKALREHVRAPQASPISTVQTLPGRRVALGGLRSRLIIAALVITIVLAGAWYLWPERQSEGSAAPQPPSRKYASLVGNWLGAPDCTLVFRLDNGKNVAGSCNTAGVRHEFAGLYEADDRVRITITRIDPDQCKTTVPGYVRIENDDTIEVSQDGWDGCQVKTGPARSRLQRSASH